MKSLNNYMKRQTKDYLRRHKMAPSRLGDLSGVPRWSVCRWLKLKDATILMSSWDKLSRYMAANP